MSNKDNLIIIKEESDKFFKNLAEISNWYLN